MKGKVNTCCIVRISHSFIHSKHMESETVSVFISNALCELEFNDSVPSE